MGTAAAPPHTTEGKSSIHDLLEQLEQEARARSRQLENEGILDQGFTDHYYPLTDRERDTCRIYRAALTLADDLDVCRALLNGERVPRHRLNRAMLQAHERRIYGRS